jgi:hypothetical protein
MYRSSDVDIERRSVQVVALVERVGGSEYVDVDDLAADEDG